MNVLQQNWYIVLIMGVLIIGSFIFNLARLKKIRTSNQDFLAEHPDAAKIYLSAKGFIISESVTVHTVDGGPPQLFYEKGKSGVYVVPGTCTAEISYSHNRPGVFYRNVTENTGVVKKELLTEPGGCYILGFDRKESAFTFEKSAGQP
jgi:hypothetical protein